MPIIFGQVGIDTADKKTFIENLQIYSKINQNNKKQKKSLRNDFQTTKAYGSTS